MIELLLIILKAELGDVILCLWGCKSYLFAKY